MKLFKFLKIMSRMWPLASTTSGGGGSQSIARNLILMSSVLALVLCASVSQAIDLAEMQAKALNNREVIQQYMTSLEQGEKDIIRARGGYYPSVDISYKGNELNEATLIEAKENSVAGGKISWNIFAGFRDKYGLQSAEFRKEVEQYKLQGVRQDVQLNVALAYLEVFERRANRRVAESAFETLGKIFRDGESRYQVGLIGKNELLKFRVDYDNADITAKAAEASLKKSVNTLSREVGSEISLDDLDFADFKNIPQPVNREEYTAKMLAGRSEIKAVELAIASATAQSQAEESGYYPRVDAVGSYGVYDDNFLTGSGSINEEELRAQVVLSMNLFQGYTTEATVAKAKLQTRSLQHQLAELRTTLQTDLHNLHIDFQVSFENVDVANRSIEQAEENLRITQLKYDEGLQRESDLLDAITSLSRAQYNYVAVLRTLFANNFRLTRMIDGF